MNQRDEIRTEIGGAARVKFDIIALAQPAREGNKPTVHKLRMAGSAAIAASVDATEKSPTAEGQGFSCLNLSDIPMLARILARSLARHSSIHAALFAASFSDEVMELHTDPTAFADEDAQSFRSELAEFVDGLLNADDAEPADESKPGLPPTWNCTCEPRTKIHDAESVKMLDGARRCTTCWGHVHACADQSCRVCRA